MGLHKYYANALTMGNLLSGVLVIIGLFIWPFGAAVNGNLTGESFSEYGALAQGERGWGMLALAMIWMAGQLFDLLDGIVARWTRTEGPMGLQLDSIADAVSSGVTPAIAGDDVFACVGARDSSSLEVFALDHGHGGDLALGSIQR